ncbi:hypothetical protein HaLaN_17703 [Haematococcus lacustris]|uniref:Uncharacterized protein n=1 Tax=Haematococcus lacustris TaxID=44745 RepID=A0A699ZX76_HAELA|nr:hypothetical protein HaLaN_17703 [Haematococcus lacustris]
MQDRVVFKWLHTSTHQLRLGVRVEVDLARLAEDPGCLTGVGCTTPSPLVVPDGLAQMEAIDAGLWLEPGLARHTMNEQLTGGGERPFNVATTQVTIITADCLDPSTCGHARVGLCALRSYNTSIMTVSRPMNMAEVVVSMASCAYHALPVG